MAKSFLGLHKWKIVCSAWVAHFVSQIVTNTNLVCKAQYLEYRGISHFCLSLFRFASWYSGGFSFFVYFLFLCLCRPFCIFQRCLYSNPKSCRSKQVRCQLSHSSPFRRTVLLVLTCYCSSWPTQNYWNQKKVCC